MIFALKEETQQEIGLTDGRLCADLRDLQQRSKTGSTGNLQGHW